jgi:FAD/FMN-containing dehydrogenase/Fe-S oxidoreductase
MGTQQLSGQEQEKHLPASVMRNLEEHGAGELSVDHVTRAVYGSDASPFRVHPLAVYCPTDAGDLRRAVEIATEEQVPVLPRGSGTSLAGQTVGEALVLDLTRHMNDIEAVYPDQATARVQPGVVLDDLNDRLRPHGLQFPPDPATHDRASIGGMVGNNSAGSRSVKYGQTIDYVRDVKAVLSGGDEVHLRPFKRSEFGQQSARFTRREQEMIRHLLDLTNRYREEIEDGFPNILRNVAGYSLDRLVDRDIVNPAHLMVGSEGTLGTMSTIKLDLAPIPEETVLGVVQFENLWDALDAVQHVVKTDPSAVELVDDFLINLARNHRIFGQYTYFIEDNPGGVLMVEYEGNDRGRLKQKLDELEQLSLLDLGANKVSHMVEPEEQQAAWKMREGGLNIVMDLEGEEKPTPFVEDAAVPVEHLRDFGQDFYEVLDEFDMDAAYYGHASVGLLHIRPVLNLKDEQHRRKMPVVARRISLLAKKYGGTYSGEHGEGMVRSWLSEEYYGDELTRAFKEVKRIFDPQHLMNPGKVVDPDEVENRFRYSGDYHETIEESYLDHSEQGGLLGSIEACNGNGLCRKTGEGTMCPSYMATENEVDSTRGRANALREAIGGNLDLDALTSEEMYEVMELCVGCKACKEECPSSVDMARLKFEFLCHYNDENGVPLRDRLFGKMGGLMRTAAWIPGFRTVSRYMSGGWLESTLKSWLDIHPDRPLPTPSETSFFSWFEQRHAGTDRGQPDLRLFLDTFSVYMNAPVAIAAVELLEDLGYTVKIEEQPCCGRPAFSQGLFDTWKKQIEGCYSALESDLEEDLPVVVLEPSCYSSLASDAGHHLSDDEAGALRDGVHTLSSFLASSGAFRDRCEQMNNEPEQVVVHPHCHQEAIPGVENLSDVLEQLPDTSANVLDAGCCGMAGSFGYEEEHYDVSEQMANHRLLPALEEAGAGATVLAPGFSCRHQIDDLSDQHVRHPVQFLRERLT